jgi:cyclic beta-1,2-glucan synthetase
MSRLPTDQLLARDRTLGHVFTADSAAVACLTNGRYSLRLNARGSGYSRCGRVALTRWSADSVCDVDGFHVYLRDPDDGHFWSAGYQPTHVAADEYEFYSSTSVAVLRRVDRELECRLEVCVAPEHDYEVRLCRLTNDGNRPRRIELTSYLEWVLTSQDADASHPAFSKLFVETQYCAASQAIFARRRPRSNEEVAVWGYHAVVRDDSPTLDHGVVEFETNRAAFIGRGGSLARPKALIANAPLTGQVGPVLDPIASLRTAIVLEPGESREVAFLLGATASREDAAAILTSIHGLPQIRALFSGAAASAVLRNGKPAPAELPAGTGKGGERYIVHPPHRRLGTSADEPPAVVECVPATVASAGRNVPSSTATETLRFDNTYGGFSADGREYVIRLQPNETGRLRLPPMPWGNVIANDAAGFIVSESGAGYTWAGNSRLNRLTAWHNDPVCDPHSEAIWVRDEDARVYWSAMPGPSPAPAEYVVRHGFGYTTFAHESHGLALTATMFMPSVEPVKITRVRIVNRSGRVRHISVTSYAHWALGGSADESPDAIAAKYDADLQAIFIRKPQGETYGEHVAFSAAVATGETADLDMTFTCDRAAFLGASGNIAAPAALASLVPLDGHVGSSHEPCTAWRVPLELPPGAECECVFLLGEAANQDAAAALVNKYRDAVQVERAVAEMTRFWHDTTSAIQIETPDREIDLVVNGWLTYQNLSCRMWARSAYYQPGGAFGFRDQLQDAAALVLVRPDLTRAQILRHASQQFLEGDVLHWWHPDTGYGLRTHFSDDLLWLPYVASSYVQTTADASIWDEETSFLIGPQVAEGNAELYLRPADSGVKATVYEHCCRAVDRGLTTGPHGLPLIGCGDWNDGFSRVGRMGQGESVWLGFFIHYVLGKLLPVCHERGDEGRIARYEQYRDQLAAALNGHGWDGAWYRRAYYDHGEPIGSARSDECQIDAIAQAWAVLSGVAPADRAQIAMDAVLQRLVCRDAGLIKLLTPPFDRTPYDPGYIKGYVPGIRENGGQYTHGVLWVIRALAKMGHGTTAVELLKMLSPVWHTATAERTAVYQTEPYVVAADVYGEPPHVGRGGWTWYTGSAGWMFRVAVESIFGLSIDGGHTLVIKPAISASWPKCRLMYRLPSESTCYEISVSNPHGRESGVTSATLDGAELVVNAGATRVPLVHDGRSHHVEILV